MMRVLCISAHPDDLALSIGGLLVRFVRKAAVSAVTVFGQTGWALRDFDLAGRSIAAVRRAEEESFFEAAGIAGQILAFPDAAVRGHSDVSELRPDPHRAHMTALVVAELVRIAREVRPLLTLAPAAIGNHVDHVAVRDAAIRLRSLCGTLVFYEDLPYAIGRLVAPPPPALRATLGGAVLPRTVCISPPHKRRLLALYASQLTEYDMHAVNRHAGLRGGSCGPAERIFAAPAGAHLLERLVQTL